MQVKPAVAKIYLEKFAQLKPGDVLELPSPMPGLSPEKTVATLLEIGAGPSWGFRLSWLGVFFADVRALVLENGGIDFVEMKT